MTLVAFEPRQNLILLLISFDIDDETALCIDIKLIDKLVCAKTFTTFSGTHAANLARFELRNDTHPGRDHFEIPNPISNQLGSKRELDFSQNRRYISSHCQRAGKSCRCRSNY